MHTYRVGDAADRWRRGDKSCEWIQRDAAAGEFFAAGHAEHGNDIPGLVASTKAERVAIVAATFDWTREACRR